MAGIELSYTEPTTGVPHAEALVQVEDVVLRLDPPHVEVAIAFYHDAATVADGRVSFERRRLLLTTPEIDALRDQFALVLYQLLLQRTEFATGQLVP